MQRSDVLSQRVAVRSRVRRYRAPAPPELYPSLFEALVVAFRNSRRLPTIPVHIGRETGARC